MIFKGEKYNDVKVASEATFHNIVKYAEIKDVAQLNIHQQSWH